MLPLLALALPLAAAPDWKLPMTLAQLAPADRDAIFKAAGFIRQGGSWKGCDGMSEVMAEDPVDGGAVRDLNNDGNPEAIVGDQGTACYGADGMGFTILTRTATGWKVVDAMGGVPTLLATRGAGGWQDIEVGGPGFCFPVLRWDGKSYKPLRFQYEGKPCKPG